MNLRSRFALCVCLGLAACLNAAGQQPSSEQPSAQNQPAQTPASPSQNQPEPKVYVPNTPEEIEREKQIEKKEQSQKMLGVVPMFGVTDRHDAPPLTTGGKFHLMLKTFQDPFIYIIVGVQAGLGQASNSFEGYGQGFQGYAKRYGANFTDSADSNFWANFIYPVIFKQDPRYFRLGEGSFKKRFWYSMEQEFVARQDSGRRNFHFSNVLGAFTAGTISNAYYPQEDRGAGLTASRAAISLFYGALGNIGVEFWPDIDQRIIHRKQWKASHPSSPPPPQDTPK